MGKRVRAGVVVAVAVLAAGLVLAEEPAEEPPPDLRVLPLEQVTAAAEAGSPEAQVELARRLSSRRDDAPGDHAAAGAWLLRAAEAGFAEAQYELGRYLDLGLLGDPDPAAAARWYRRAAEQGHPRAQNALGWMTQWGVGVERDEAAAAGWYRRAAEQGLASAQDSLGSAYAEGWGGVARDDAEAVRWFRRAAEQADGPGSYHLAEMLAAGRGTARDDAEAARWYRQAAEGDFAPAQTALARFYAEGRGLPASPVCAYLWAALAAAGGDEGGGQLRDGLAVRLSPADRAEGDRLFARTRWIEGFLSRPLCPGEPVKLSLQAVVWPEAVMMLRALTGLDVEVPPGATGTLAAEIEAPWETAVSTLLASGGHGWRRDGDRLLIEPLAPPSD